MFVDVNEDYRVKRISLDNIDIEKVFDQCEREDDFSDWFVSKNHENKLNIGTAKCHYEYVRDNEDHRVLKNFLNIDHIYEVYPKRTITMNVSMKLIKVMQRTLLCVNL